MEQKLDFNIRLPEAATVEALERIAKSAASDDPVVRQQLHDLAAGTIAALHWCSDLHRIITTLTEQTTFFPKPAPKDTDESPSVPR